jgi:hypothetical protein
LDYPFKIISHHATTPHIYCNNSDTYMYMIYLSEKKKKVVACLFAMVAQFYPMPFPDSRPLLGTCCVAYFASSTILQFIVTYVEKDCIMTTLPVNLEQDSRSENISNKTRAGGSTGLRINTIFPRFSYDYTVSIQVGFNLFFSIFLLCT